ncbi:hypothetical protein ACFSKU_13445 [Pontibacter silvestris]|uniref:Uncharacterized protein n=1 Tax=Pontibacter silvestris TaxID=2305183 RepID=A0ABW4WYS3_9BACT|nr:hypothetical protein [Pontibacter silvestris]MCC9135547.1 hypothetical protein [Pontibacter silvestris]
MLIIIFSSGCARKNFFATTPVSDATVYKQLQSSPETVDSVTVQAGKHYKRSWFYKLFWGEHYRSVWLAPVKAPILDMDTLKGGLEVERKGGGFQTTSFALVGGNGFTYALRSVDKDPSTVLSKTLKKSFISNVIRDQMSALNPYGALIIPPLAEAAGVPHATPKLVYVRPHDSSFGEFEHIASDRLYTIEEKYNDDRALDASLGNAIDIAGSKKVLRDRYQKDDHFIDQKAFARARMLDILINDWDRHRGQWEWAEYDADGETIYRPIPKDRDNAFYRMQDGVFPWLFGRNWAIRKFESFDDEINDVKALSINSQFIDTRSMAELSRQDFVSIAKDIQEQVTDEVIDEAVKRYPKEVFKIIGESTRSKLKSRRAELVRAAEEFYEILAEEVVIAGTDEEERFEVKRLNNNETSVTVYRNSDDKVVYKRTFYRSETKIIKLYGLGEDDEFDVSGEVDKGIVIVIVGGPGEDEIKDTSRVKGWSKKTIVYDTRRGNELEFGPETKDKTSKSISVHLFDREGFK